MNKKTLKNIIILGSLGIILIILYTFFFVGDDEAPLLSVSGESEQEKVIEEFFALRDSLKSITLDTGLFEKNIYTSLEDYSVELLPRPQGRANPFAPF